MKKTLLLLYLTIVFFSCGKEKEMLKYTGTLYKDCAKNPAAHVELRVYQEDENSLGLKSGGELARFITDDNGFFSVTFEDDNGAPIQIETINIANPYMLGVTVIQNIEQKSIDLGDIYLNNRGNAYVFIETTQNYNSTDTLHIWNKKYAGPFSSGAIDSIIDYYFVKQYSYLIEDDKIKYRWALNPTSESDFQVDYFELSGCGVIDTFVIKID